MKAQDTLIDKTKLMEEWDFENNQDLDPSELSLASNKVASWICSLCNNKWKTSIYQRAINGSCCRKCSARRRLEFDVSSSLFTTHPEIAKDWSIDENAKLSPKMFSKGSRYIVNWKCHTCGSRTKESIHNYNGCIKCKKDNKLQEKSLQTQHPNLAKEWHKTKNGDKLPKDFAPHSNKYAWWNCMTCGHDWQTKISNRASLGRGCPLCANRVIVKGKNDLKTTHPYLAKEWHKTKNNDLKPSDVTYGSGKKVWWLCHMKHEYKASILHRSHGTECPKCNAGRQTSFAEQTTFFYVKKLYPDAISRFTAVFLERMELDIYIPSIKLAIEYDGEAWHDKDTLKREERKYQICKENKIKLIRLREKMPKFPSDIADLIFSTEKMYEPKNLERMIVDLLRHIDYSQRWIMSSSRDVNINRDRSKILQYKTDLKAKSLKHILPKIAKEWDQEKNGKQLPEHFTPGSTHKAWWICPTCNKSYRAEIGKRTAKKSPTSCPRCGIEKSTQAKRKSVDMIDPNTNKILKTFISISDASREMKINSSNISMACNGERPKAGGYIWRYSKSTQVK